MNYTAFVLSGTENLHCKCLDLNFNPISTLGRELVLWFILDI